MKTYNFRIVIEPDEDFDGNPSGFHAYAPVLQKKGASTWGETEAEAMKNIEEALRLVLDSMREHGEPIPEEPADEVDVTVEPVWQSLSDPCPSTTRASGILLRERSFPL